LGKTLAKKDLQRLQKNFKYHLPIIIMSVIHTDLCIIGAGPVGLFSVLKPIIKK
jgi:hypothetical protein